MHANYYNDADGYARCHDCNEVVIEVDAPTDHPYYPLTGCACEDPEQIEE